MEWETGDTARYVALASALADGRGFGLEYGGVFEPEGWRLPGYPLFLALTHFIFEWPLPTIVAAQSLLYLASVVAAWRTADRVFGNEVASTFLIMSAFYPFVAYSAVQLSAETLAIFLLSVLFYLLTIDRALQWGIGGGLLAMACYVRPTFAPLLLAIPVGAFVARARAPKIISFAVAAVALQLPWAFRNHMVFGHFTSLPAISGSGPSLFLATWQAKLPSTSLISYGMRGDVDEEIRKSRMLEQVSAANERIGAPADTVFVSPESYLGNVAKQNADRVFREMARENIAKWPVLYTRSYFINTVRIWFSRHIPGSIPWPMRAVLVFIGFGVLPLAMYGLWRGAFGRGAGVRQFTYCYGASFLFSTLALSLFHTEARYTIPLRLPLLVFAASAMVAVARHRCALRRLHGRHLSVGDSRDVV